MYLDVLWSLVIIAATCEVTVDFRVELLDKNGTPRGELAQVQSVIWSFVLNGVGTAQVNVDTDDIRATADLLTKAPLMVIYSDAGNWGGSVKKELKQNGYSLSIGAWGNERLLRGRITAKTRALDTFTNGIIAEQLLRDANGIWQTSVIVGPTIYSAGIQHYYEIHHDDLLERFQDMADTDGHDFEVTWDRKLNWYERKGADKPNVVLAEGRNIVRWPTYSYSEDNITNWQDTVGAGTTWADTITALTVDNASQNTYGFWQHADVFGDISVQGTLNTRSATLLANRKDPEEVLDLIIVDRPSGLWQTFIEGDSVRVILPSYNLDQGFDKVVRVLAREINARSSTMRVIVEVQ